MAATDCHFYRERSRYKITRVLVPVRWFHSRLPTHGCSGAFDSFGCCRQHAQRPQTPPAHFADRGTMIRIFVFSAILLATGVMAAPLVPVNSENTGAHASRENLIRVAT